ncbi:MAG: glycosyltransferase [Bacteroidaceae bacterium]
MNTPLISIIIPVYNVEQFLPQCLESVLAQTFTDLEIILINDGSTDSSAQICDNYSSRDERIKVVHKSNTGQADSRNLGISIASASLIGFVDADDFIAKDMYAVLYNELTKSHADISICSYYWQYTNKAVPQCNKGDIITYSGGEALRVILQDKEIKSFVWDKLFRKEILSEPFPKGRYYEDHATTFKWIKNANKVIYIREPKYYYRQRIESSCNSVNPLKEYNFLQAEQERYDYVTSHNIFPENPFLYETRVVKAGLKHGKNIAQHSKSLQESLKYIHLIRETLKLHTSIGFKELGLIYYLRLLKIQYCPLFYFYEINLIYKLKFWKKNKLKNYY